MTNEEIKELIQIAREMGIAELEVQRDNSRVRITVSRSTSQEVVMPTMVIPSAASAATLTQVPAAVPASIAEAAPAAAVGQSTATLPDESHNDLIVKSPIVGTYYDAPSLGSPTFVKVGDRIEPKHVLCIIESMKLMNEIEAEVTGTLIAKLVENGRPVEYGEPLFSIRPFSA